MEREKELVRREYRFVRDSDDEDEEIDASTRRYEAALYREYVVADLSRYKDKLVGLRWRTADEVKRGKGERECGARGCAERASLRTMEVPFGYEERGEKRQALVKAVLCGLHMEQLMEAKQQTSQAPGEEKKAKKAKKKKKKEKKDGETSSKRVRLDDDGKR